MRIIRALPFCLAAAALPATGAPLSVQPDPGLWEVTSRVLLENQDITPLLLQVQRHAMQRMTPAERARLANVNTETGAIRQCIDAEKARQLSDPEVALRQFGQEMNHCVLQLDETSGNKVQFSGNCPSSARGGFSGTFSGEITYVSPQHATGVVNGHGTLPLGQLNALLNGGGSNSIRALFDARRIAASCAPANSR